MRYSSNGPQTEANAAIALQQRNGVFYTVLAEMLQAGLGQWVS
jgi:hypothetical protein